MVLGALQMSGRGIVVNKFAVKYMISAARFSRLCGEFERDRKDHPADDYLDIQVSYVSAAVIHSVCSLEAHANERLAEIPHPTEKGAARFREIMKKRSVFEKHDALLILDGKEPMPRDGKTWDHAKALVKLRNDLVHALPVWPKCEEAPHGKNDVKGLTKRLQGKFALNPFIPKEDQSVYRYFSYGCAGWAVESAKNFIRTFCERAGITLCFARFEDKVDPQCAGK